MPQARTSTPATRQTPTSKDPSAAPRGRVAVVGAGSIGVAWAVVFARAGRPVALYDHDPDRLVAAQQEVRFRLDALQTHDLLDESPGDVAGRVTVHDDLHDAVRGAEHIQECAPEDIELKQSIFARLDAAAHPEVTIASSSSSLTASLIAKDLAGRARCLVVHPGNPPYLIPVAEVVPAPFTSTTAVERVEQLLTGAGLTPIRLGREIEGFVFNRLQGALLREAYCLVRDGVVSARDIDRVVQAGLGRRWSVVGPFATAELNTRGGLEAHAQRLGPAYARMGAERGQNDPWTSQLVAQVAAEIHEDFPPQRWNESVEWRDRQLMQLERERRMR